MAIFAISLAAQRFILRSLAAILRQRLSDVVLLSLVQRPRGLPDGLSGPLRPGYREGRGRLGGIGGADPASV